MMEGMMEWMQVQGLFNLQTIDLQWKGGSDWGYGLDLRNGASLHDLWLQR